MVTDGKKLFFIMDGYGLISCNSDGTDIKQLLKQQAPNYHELSYSNGWLYYVAPDGIYKMKTDGKQKTKLTSEKGLVHDEDICDVDVSLMVGDSLYYCIGQSLYCVDNNGERLIEKGFLAFYSQYGYFTSYEDNVYYFGIGGFLMKYDPTKAKSEKVLSSGIKSLSAVANDTLYYVDDNDNICLYNLKTKKKETLPEKLRTTPYSVIQFHNYLIYFNRVENFDYVAEITALDLKTNKKYNLATIPASTMYVDVYPANDCVYIKNFETVSKLYFMDGDVIIEPMTGVNDALAHVYD